MNRPKTISSSNAIAGSAILVALLGLAIVHFAKDYGEGMGSEQISSSARRLAEERYPVLKTGYLQALRATTIELARKGVWEIPEEKTTVTIVKLPGTVNCNTELATTTNYSKVSTKSRWPWDTRQSFRDDRNTYVIECPKFYFVFGEVVRLEKEGRMYGPFKLPSHR
jgi:hypothetical protein